MTLRERAERPFSPFSLDDPLFWCSPCADDEHALCPDVYVDVHGELHACLCPECE